MLNAIVFCHSVKDTTCLLVIWCAYIHFGENLCQQTYFIPLIYDLWVTYGSIHFVMKLMSKSSQWNNKTWIIDMIKIQLCPFNSHEHQALAFTNIFSILKPPSLYCASISGLEIFVILLLQGTAKMALSIYSIHRNVAG